MLKSQRLFHGISGTKNSTFRSLFGAVGDVSDLGNGFCSGEDGGDGDSTVHLQCASVFIVWWGADDLGLWQRGGFPELEKHGRPGNLGKAGHQFGALGVWRELFCNVGVVEYKRRNRPGHNVAGIQRFSAFVLSSGGEDEPVGVGGDGDWIFGVVGVVFSHVGIILEGWGVD